MSVLSWLGAFLGSTAFAPFSQWWNQGTGPQPMPQGSPPMDYNQLTQAQLLASFSDSIGPTGITPRSLRNFVASTITSNPGGSPPSIPMPLAGWTTATRPTGMVGPAIGYNYDLRQLDMWDDHLGQWVNPSFQGGLVGGATTFASPVTFDSSILVDGPITAADGIIAAGLPTSCLGQNHGQFWNNGQTVSICP